MVITSARVMPIGKGKLLAVAAITLCDCFVLRSMRLVLGKNRRYVAMPLRHARAGACFEVYHPISREAREAIEKVIIQGYETGAKDVCTESDTVVYLGSECSDFVITGVRVRPYEEVKLRGFASITIDDCLAVTGIKIIFGRDRRFVQMPNIRRGSGFRDLAFPTNTETRHMIEKAIFSEFGKVSGEPSPV